MRYQIWNGTDEVYTPSGDTFSAGEWANRYGWVKRPGAKMVITAGVVNGGCALEFESFKQACKSQGAAITDSMTDEEVLAAIEAFEDNPPDPGPSVEERTAAALEFLAMNSLPDEN